MRFKRAPHSLISFARFLLRSLMHTVWDEQKKLMEFQAEHGIATEGFSPLMWELMAFLRSIIRVNLLFSPIRYMPDGPVAKEVNKIAERLDAQPEQILLAWARAKGAVVVTWVISHLSFSSLPSATAGQIRSSWFVAPLIISTTISLFYSASTKKERLERYLAAGDIHLTASDEEAIDKAGAKPNYTTSQYWLKRLNYVALLMLAGYIAYHWCCVSLTLTE